LGDPAVTHCVELAGWKQISPLFAGILCLRSRTVQELAPIDVRHMGTERAVGVYLVDTEDGPALFDCGPTSTLETLKTGLRERGLELQDVRHLLLSHIHLDHAGAAGAIVREHPSLQVHVSGIGAPHLVDPSRLEASARRLYGEAFDPLWGELAPVPEGNVHIVGERVVGLDCFPTTGHARHHVSYLHEDGTLYAGDAAGVRITPGRYVAPVSPPPEFDPEAWRATIDELGRRAPARLALIHFGIVEDVDWHLAALRGRLDLWTERVGAGMTLEEFSEAALADAGDEADAVGRAAPFWQSFQGIERYWRKRREAT
jgi:glyoxylase-like metal-dependent hydrolase (beta-lactamase superfamily II)